VVSLERQVRDRDETITGLMKVSYSTAHDSICIESSLIGATVGPYFTSSRDADGPEGHRTAKRLPP